MTTKTFSERLPEGTRVKVDPIVDSNGILDLLSEEDRCGFGLDIQLHQIVSPAEQLFYAHWMNIVDHSEREVLVPQYAIGKFRVDFCISLTSYFVNSDFPFPMDWLEWIDRLLNPPIVIEIDGFNYHEAIPSKAEKDKIRERHISQAGYQVYRFAAREVFKNPEKCVEEIWFGVAEVKLSQVQRLVRSAVTDVLTGTKCPIV